MTGRQEYDRTKDRQRTVDEYMVNIIFKFRVRLRLQNTIHTLHTQYRLIVLTVEMKECMLFHMAIPIPSATPLPPPTPQLIVQKVIKAENNIMWRTRP
jgi:hypothetical protein